MFTNFEADVLTQEDLRIIDYIMSDSHAESYPEHLTHG